MNEINKLKLNLENIVSKYKQYENLTSDNPPKYAGVWTPSYGFLRVCENSTAWQYGLPKSITIGVDIGSKFANFDPKIIKSLKEEVKTILNKLVTGYGGYIVDSSGSAYGTVGWCKD